LGPGDLNKALCGLPVLTNANVIRSIDSLDDAGVYKLSDDLAIVQTVDFFTPIVNDPYDFGQIAVANALSDVYAMGGKPLTAMNIVCFPVKIMDIKVLQDILRGGIDKMKEAGVVLVGGHSIDDKEIKYGLSVTGTIHPKKMITNAGARAGDKLILTKPLGTGIANTALKAGAADSKTVKKITGYMAALNKTASEVMIEFEVHSCTDITGFGFIGHTWQLAQNSKVGIKIYSASIPFFPEVKEFAGKGFLPGGLQRNRDYYGNKTEFAPGVSDFVKDILFDPQTSGGLLIVAAPDIASTLLKRLLEKGLKDSTVVGEVISKPEKILIE
jgi:selenide, water dikinase